MEHRPFGVHGGGADDEDDWRAAPSADAPRRLNIRREVNVVAAHLAKPLAFDGCRKALDGPMIEFRGRRCGRERQIDCDGVALACTDTREIGGQLEALLVVVVDNVEQGFDVSWKVPRRQRREHCVDVRPPLRVEFELRDFGAMAQPKR